MAGNSSRAWTVNTTTVDFTTTEMSTKSLMASSVMTDMVTSSSQDSGTLQPATEGSREFTILTDFTPTIDFTSTLDVSSTLDFTSLGSVTSQNSSSVLPGGNSSFSLPGNATQEADLEELNIAMAMSMIPTIVYLALLMVVGAVGNTIVFLVYYRRFKPSATRTFVLAMSVCDFLANILCLPSEIIDIRYTFTFDLPWLCKSVRFTNSFLTLTSAFVLVAVARDRFKKICRPLEKPHPMRRIKVYVLICALASLALSLLFGALNGSRTVPTGVGNSTGITCSVSDENLDTLFPLVYNAIMALAFISCVVIMTVSYIRIALELWRHKKKQARVSGAAAITKASSPAKKPAKGPVPVVEDGSSGPIRDAHSESKTSSTAELIPMKAFQGNSKEVKNKTISPFTNRGSDKHVQLLSVKNFNYEGPSSSKEDSDEGCFSSCSVDTTSTSAEFSREAPGQKTGGDLQPHINQVQIINEMPDKEFNNGTSKPRSSQSDVSQQQNNKCDGKNNKESQNKASSSSNLKNSQNNPSLPKSTESPDIHSADDSPPTPHRKFADRSSSLLQRLLTPRKRHHDGSNKRPDAGRKTKASKKQGAVKAIPSSTTLMMFVLTATFIVNYLPHLIIIILRAMSDTFGQGLEGAMLNAFNIGLRSYFMNCAANSLVYGFCSARFRQECRLLFSRK